MIYWRAFQVPWVQVGHSGTGSLKGSPWSWIKGQVKAHMSKWKESSVETNTEETLIENLWSFNGFFEFEKKKPLNDIFCCHFNWQSSLNWSLPLINRGKSFQMSPIEIVGLFAQIYGPHEFKNSKFAINAAFERYVTLFVAFLNPPLTLFVLRKLGLCTASHKSLNPP